MRRLTTLAAAGLVVGCSAGSGDPGARTDDPAPATAPAGDPAAAAPHTDSPRAGAPPAARGSSAASLLSSETVDANLARLRDLQIFAVYGDIENRNCYAGPCIEDPATAFEAEAAPQMRVADFTALALAAAEVPMSDCYVDVEGTFAQDNLTYLRSLQVAAIGDLVLEQPKNNPNCYNLPCDADKAAAAEINRDRARRLGSIAAAFRSRP